MKKRKVKTNKIKVKKIKNSKRFKTYRGGASSDKNVEKVAPSIGEAKSTVSPSMLLLPPPPPPPPPPRPQLVSTRAARVVLTTRSPRASLRPHGTWSGAALPTRRRRRRCGRSPAPTLQVSRRATLRGTCLPGDACVVGRNTVAKSDMLTWHGVSVRLWCELLCSGEEGGGGLRQV